MTDMEYWIWISRMKNISPIIIIKLLKKYIYPEEIWNLSKEELEKENIRNVFIEEILKRQYRENLDKYKEYIIKNNINVLTIYDKKYPTKLKQIYNPPLILFTKGNEELLNKRAIAIIGSRDASEYGKNISKNISSQLAKENIVIISGLAKGIDTKAHEGAISKEKAATIAVIGSGIDRIYPKENTGLYNDIIEKHGLVISEYVIGTEPKPENFPKRNRLISGLAEGIVVVEAKKKSGAMITVDFALEQGKQIYSVPGNINSINSEGTNYLIKEGAKIITGVEDILEDLF